MGWKTETAKPQRTAKDAKKNAQAPRQTNSALTVSNGIKFLVSLAVLCGLAVSVSKRTEEMIHGNGFLN